jgi:S-formylglutathione hydrolase FrmB
VGVIDNTSVSYPISDLAHLPADEYYVQALLDSNIDLGSLNAPGNFYSPVQKVLLDPANGGTIKLVLDKAVPPETLPADTDYVKYLKIQSPLLTRFHGRPIYVRAAVLLPRTYLSDVTSKFPLIVNIGGYGSKYTRASRYADQKSPAFESWAAGDNPQMIELFVDGDGPNGDSYQVDSANNGPYGASLTQELIPEVEKRFRAIGRPDARFLTGGSTGGWVSMALQIFYPDFFNGTWSGFPDPLDFRAYQLVNIYKDENAYVNAKGFERPSAREANGDTEFTMRLECQKENVYGVGDSYTMSGQPWGAWNAVYSPKGADGRPAPLWDPKTGKINHEVAEQWKKYDLRLVVEQNWMTLGPKLRGKIHIWVGEDDDYFLNNGVHLFDDFISKAEPKYEGWIIYDGRGRHGWMAKTQSQLMKEMAARVGK